MIKRLRRRVCRPGGEKDESSFGKRRPAEEGDRKSLFSANLDNCAEVVPLVVVILCAFSK